MQYILWQQYVMKVMGEKYIMPPVLDYKAIHTQSSSMMPIVFILSPGADPAFDIFNLGEEMGFKPGQKLKYMALGQGDNIMIKMLLHTLSL